MKINPSSHVPIYLQIVAEIRSAVAAEVYRPGEALPSLRNWRSSYRSTRTPYSGHTTR